MGQAQYATATGSLLLPEAAEPFRSGFGVRDHASRIYRGSNEASRGRLIGVGLVVLLHIAFIYALVSGLAEHAVDVLKGPLETRIIQEIKAPPKVDLPPPPVLAPPPPPYIPPPEVQIRQTPAPVTSTAITVVTTKAPPAAPAEVKHVIVQPGAAAGRSACANPDDIYPAVSKELGEEGKVLIDALVGADGSVVQTRLNHSSGAHRLDAAAASGAAQICHFVPGTVDGKPAPMWVTIPFVFTQTE